MPVYVVEKMPGKLKKAAKVEPVACSCGESADVTRPAAGRWLVVCPKADGAFSIHHRAGHTMWTKRQAIQAWNDVS